MSIWQDPAKLEALSAYVSEGLSASEIAARIGGGVSRNAVIGAIHRHLRAEVVEPARGDLKRRIIELGMQKLPPQTIAERTETTKRTVIKTLSQARADGIAVPLYQERRANNGSGAVANIKRRRGKAFAFNTDQNPEDKKAPTFFAEEVMPDDAVTLMELSDSQCHWCFGTKGNFRYCGKKAEQGAYCGFHAGKMWPKGQPGAVTYIPGIGKVDLRAEVA